MKLFYFNQKFGNIIKGSQFFFFLLFLKSEFLQSRYIQKNCNLFCNQKRIKY